MNLKYSIFHVFVHLMIIFSLYYFFNLKVISLIIVILGTAWIDFDHIFLVKRTGVRGYFKLRLESEFGKPRKYPLHNFLIITIAVMFSFALFNPARYLFGLFFLATFLHLCWDLLEDVIIFKMPIDHWEL